MEISNNLAGIEEKIEFVGRWMPMIKKINNKDWAEKTADVWIRVFSECSWDSPDDIAWAPVPSYSDTRLLDHVNVVTEGSYYLADLMNKQQDFGMDLDKIIIVGLLHDVSKVIEFEPDGNGGAQLSEIGKNIQHAVLGAVYAKEAGLPLEIVNMIVTHTPQSNRKSLYREGFVVTFVDSADADTMYWLHGDPMETYLKM